MLTTALILQSTFLIGQIPDTQHYVTDPQRMPHFAGITASQAGAAGMLDFVTHVGDLTQNALPSEFQRAMGAMRILDGLVPYRIAIGNHDYGGGRKPPLGDSTEFERHVGPVNSFYLDPRGRFLSIHLEWQASDAALEWAQGILDLHPRTETILTTHEFLHSSGVRSPSPIGDNTTEEVWRRLIELNPQITMVLNGHSHGRAERTDTTALGREVHQLLFNTQDDPFGGQGFQRVIYAGPMWIWVYDFTLSWQGLAPDRTRMIRLPREVRPIPRITRLAPVADTFVFPYYGGNSRRGGSDVLRASDDDHLLIDFGPVTVPAGGRAVLSVYVDGYLTAGDGFTIHRMLRPWSENDSWNSLGGLVPGVDYEAAGIQGLAAGHGHRTHNIDVTAALPAPYGWVLRGAPRPSGFRSREWHVPLERPKLIVAGGQAPR